MRKCICPCFRHPLCMTHTLPLNKPSLAQEAGQAWKGLYRHPPFHPQHSGSPSTRICNRLKQLERQIFAGPSVLPVKMSCKSNRAGKNIDLSICVCLHVIRDSLLATDGIGEERRKSVMSCQERRRCASVMRRYRFCCVDESIFLFSH